MSKISRHSLLIFACLALFLLTACASTEGLRTRVWLASTYQDIRDEYVAVVNSPDTSEADKDYLKRHVGPIVNTMKYALLAVHHYEQGEWAKFQNDLTQIYRRAEYIVRDISDLIIALDSEPIDKTTVVLELEKLQNLTAFLSPSYFGRYKTSVYETTTKGLKR